MHIVDAHFHWYPRTFFEHLCSRNSYPRCERNGKGGYFYIREEGKEPTFDFSSIWFELDPLLERMNEDGHEVDVITSLGPFSVHWSDVPPELGREDAVLWNEEIAATQRRLGGRFWGIGSVPLTDGKIAVEVLDHAVKELGLLGVNIPSSIGHGGRIDDPKLEPFYDRLEALGAVLFLHPTDTQLEQVCEGYDGALYLSLGRVMDVSLAAARLIFSGILERHPKLKVYMTHTGGVLPYQSGRMDKTTPQAGVGSFSRGVKLPQPASTYIKRLHTDIVQPNALGLKFAIDYFGIDHIIYGTDYPCWNPTIALKFFNEMGLSQADQQKIFQDNAVKFFGLDASAAGKSRYGAKRKEAIAS
jgi:aminocarboxymuconate-semialdehyde decarboxylase